MKLSDVPVGSEIRIGEYDLSKTCSMFPEQYDVFRNSEKVGYLRLRGGWFYAESPDVDGVLVYEAYPNGEGCFQDGERDFYLCEAIKAIDKYRLDSGRVSIVDGGGV